MHRILWRKSFDSIQLRILQFCHTKKTILGGGLTISRYLYYLCLKLLQIFSCFMHNHVALFEEAFVITRSKVATGVHNTHLMDVFGVAITLLFPGCANTPLMCLTIKPMGFTQQLYKKQFNSICIVEFQNDKMDETDRPGSDPTMGKEFAPRWSKSVNSGNLKDHVLNVFRLFSPTWKMIQASTIWAYNFSLSRK